jgi:anti-sigma B factor antagonist
MSLVINKNNNEKFIEIFPIGEMDIYTSPMFKDQVLETINKESKDIVINAEKLEYIDSTGLGSVMAILKLMKEKGLCLKIINVRKNIYKLFDITGFSKVIDIEKIEGV